MNIETPEKSMGIIRRGTRSLLRSPLRLVLVGVLLGTSLTFVAALLGLSTNAQADLAALNSQLGTDVTVSQVVGGHLEDLSTSQMTLAQQAPGVTHSAEEVYRTQEEVPGQPLHLPARPPAIAADGYYYVWWGLSPGLPLSGRANTPAHLTSGRTFTAAQNNANVVLLSGSMASANHLGVGSVLTYNHTPLTVIGLFTTGTALGDLSVIVPLHTAERVLQARVTYLILYASSSAHVPMLVQYLHQHLGTSVNVSSHANDFAGTLTTLTSIARTSQDGLLAALVASTLIIVFTILLALRERTQEIGVLKALGASPWQIIGQFSIEALDLTVGAALFAAALLLIAGPWLTHALPMLPPQPALAASAVPAGPLVIALSPQALLVMLGLALALALLASMLSAWYVTRLKPAQVLRAE
jgi:ABC-type antimicrobial peptide transport system permease subunit